MKRFVTILALFFIWFSAELAHAQVMLKQSTAKVISMGPFVLFSDGVTLQTGLVSAIDHATTGIKLSKNGGALTIRHQGVTASTYDSYGNYLVTLDATDTATLGPLRVQFVDATTVVPVWQDFVVVPANTFDSLIGGTVYLQSDVKQVDTVNLGTHASGMLPADVRDLLGTAWLTPGVAGTPDINVKLAGGTAVTLDSNNVLNVDAKYWNALATVALPATPTNITAGTITTATNLTNAPTVGDFTTAMKASITTAASIGQIKKNTAFAGFPFYMEASDGTPATGLTITATRSIGGVAFASCTNSATEISAGGYTIDLSAADLNGNAIMFKFTATGAKNRMILIITQP